jgi:hypothetical protein
MNVGKTLFAQLMEFVPWTSLTRIVERYSGNVSEQKCGQPWMPVHSGGGFHRRHAAQISAISP